MIFNFRKFLSAPKIDKNIFFISCVYAPIVRNLEHPSLGNFDLIYIYNTS